MAAAAAGGAEERAIVAGDLGAGVVWSGADAISRGLKTRGGGKPGTGRGWSKATSLRNSGRSVYEHPMIELRPDGKPFRIYGVDHFSTTADAPADARRHGLNGYAGTWCSFALSNGDGTYKAIWPFTS